MSADEVERSVQRAMNDWRIVYDPAEDGPTMAEFIVWRLRKEGHLAAQSGDRPFTGEPHPSDSGSTQGGE